MGKSAFLFPGQGSQKVGMGRSYYMETAVGKDLFSKADAILGFSLSELCFEGPEADLTRTENAQPAIFVVSVIAHHLLAARGRRPDVVAGHSLGEYSALVAAGVMSFEDGLRVVRKRGELMSGVARQVPGAMAAILNLPAEEVEAVCREAGAAGVVEVANYNSPRQTVISGEVAGVERAMELAKARGARRAVRLNVAAAFHSSLMAPLAEEMAQVLAAVEMQAPRVPVIANVTADYVRTADEVRGALVRQVAGSVRWTETIERLARDGVDAAVEVGPGKVLTGLTPQIAPDMAMADTEQALSG